MDAFSWTGRCVFRWAHRPVSQFRPRASGFKVYLRLQMPKLSAVLTAICGHYISSSCVPRHFDTRSITYARNVTAVIFTSLVTGERSFNPRRH